MINSGGNITNLLKPRKDRKPGCLSNQSGRWKICVTNNKKSKSYLRSSLIDLYKHGNWCPKDLEIDHINRDQSDDRICNLRRVSRQKMFRIQLLGHNVVTNLYIIIKMVGMLDLLAPIRVKCVGVALIQH